MVINVINPELNREVIERGCLAGAARGPVKYIVLDHVERLRESDILAVLLRLRELTGAHTNLIELPSLVRILTVYGILLCKCEIR